MIGAALYDSIGHYDTIHVFMLVYLVYGLTLWSISVGVNPFKTNQESDQILEDLDNIKQELEPVSYTHLTLPTTPYV